MLKLSRSCQSSHTTSYQLNVALCYSRTWVQEHRAADGRVAAHTCLIKIVNVLLRTVKAPSILYYLNQTSNILFLKSFYLFI